MDEDASAHVVIEDVVEVVEIDSTMAPGELGPTEETPCLWFRSYGIALHFVAPRLTYTLPPNEVGLAAASPEFASFERDILMYAFREAGTKPAKVFSRIVEVPAFMRHVQVLFPAELRYTTEGEEVHLPAWGSDGGRLQPRRPCTLHASRSQFEDGTNVLHLVIGPDLRHPDDAAMTEYDLVKLIRLWEGDPGEDPMASFEIIGGEVLSLSELTQRVFGLTRQPRPRSGTLQLMLQDATITQTSWDDVLDRTQRLIAAAANEEPRLAGEPFQMPEITKDCVKAMVAVAGIVQGILDFNDDLLELGDVFKPFRIKAADLFGVHKGTLLHMVRWSRAFESAMSSIGISPYLLLPQAALVFNGEQLRLAYAAADRMKNERAEIEAAQAEHPWTASAIETLRVLSGASTRTAEHVTRAMSDALEDRLLPNIFEYEMLTFLFVNGMQSRGIDDLKQALERQLNNVKVYLDEARELRHKNNEMILLIIGACLTVLLVLDTLNKYMGWLPSATDANTARALATATATATAVLGGGG